MRRAESPVKSGVLFPEYAAPWTVTASFTDIRQKHLQNWVVHDKGQYVQLTLSGLIGKGQGLGR
jgi:hypothetical protein